MSKNTNKVINNDRRSFLRNSAMAIAITIIATITLVGSGLAQAQSSQQNVSTSHTCLLYTSRCV